jgi:STE24 endopeptidase
MTFTFAQVFLAALCFYFLVHSFTCLAEIIHLRRTINEVPEPLRAKISLAQHQKAANYDIARTKLNWLEVTVTTALIVYLTAGDGINAISDWLMNTVGDQFAFHWMLPSAIALIFVLCDLPFCWYKEFRLREAFDYTKQVPSAWFKNYFLTTLLGWITILPILWIALFLWQGSGSYWWILGWAIFAVYLIFSLNLARRLNYFIKPSRGRLIENEALKKQLDILSEKAGFSIAEVRVAKAKDNEELPPAFAFGHRQNVKLYFRHDIYERISLSDLQAIAAHALARNLSHMYFQAWFMCAAAAFFVFAFLAWFAPQSWFLDEIGLRVYGPGPYYGSVLTFAIVALPVLLFPFKLPMDAFLRHLIFASDTFAMKHTGLKVTVNSLIELFPTPMRHSSVTLGFFDLLFSHEPSLMSRIHHVQRKSEILQTQLQQETQRNDSLTVRHQLENVSSALISKQEQKVIDAEARDKRLHHLSRQFEKVLVKRAESDTTAQSALPLESYQDPYYKDALEELNASNANHPMYGKSLSDGVKDLWEKLCEFKRKHFSKKPSEAVEEKTRAENAPVDQIKTQESTVPNEDPVAMTPVTEAIEVSTPKEELPPETAETEENRIHSDKFESTENESPVAQPPAFEVLEPIEEKADVVQSETTHTASEQNTESNEVPLFGKASRRIRALKTMTQRQRQLFEKTHNNAS